MSDRLSSPFNPQKQGFEGFHRVDCKHTLSTIHATTASWQFIWPTSQVSGILRLTDSHAPDALAAPETPRKSLVLPTPSQVFAPLRVCSLFLTVLVSIDNLHYSYSCRHLLAGEMQQIRKLLAYVIDILQERIEGVDGLGSGAHAFSFAAQSAPTSGQLPDPPSDAVCMFSLRARQSTGHPTREKITCAQTIYQLILGQGDTLYAYHLHKYSAFIPLSRKRIAMPDIPRKYEPGKYYTMAVSSCDGM
ncbi:hypothetical protein [Paracoccus sp. (in: a-proteobacteria)]|uniref:hypothetical protein n=1 Tax=Paracoccus sp. TaxID=267 RepID=UPI0028AD7550|nr:hypothetical protein [Paracoccus sp. (in: a-proteobacteria)]